MSELLHYRKLVLVIVLVAISFPRVIETEECDVKEIGKCFHPGTYCYETRFERILKCEGKETYHCAYNQVYGHLVEACAKRIQCGKGKEPWIQYKPENIVEIVCHYCRNYEKKYNPESNRWSDEYYECDYDKDVCLPNENKIRCSLENEVDKYTKNRRCRCDVKKGYRIDKNYPEDKHACTDDVGWGCILAYCFKNENKDVLLIGYRCASKCPAGFNRSDEYSDECLPIPTRSSTAKLKISTTQKPTSALSVPSPQTTKQDTTITTKSTTSSTTPTTTSAPLPPNTDGKPDTPPEGSHSKTKLEVGFGAAVGIVVVIVACLCIYCKKKGWPFDRTNCPPCRPPRQRTEKTQNGQHSGQDLPLVELEPLLSHDDLNDAETKKATMVYAIDRGYSMLVENIEPKKLLDKLVTEGVLTNTENKDIRKRVSSSPSDMNREIIEKIRTRGWCAYLEFKECLREVGAEYCFKQLQKKERKYREQLDQGEGSNRGEVLSDSSMGVMDDPPSETYIEVHVGSEQLDQGEGSHRGDVSLDGIGFMDDDLPSETSSQTHGSHDNMKDGDATTAKSKLTNEQEEKINLLEEECSVQEP